MKKLQVSHWAPLFFLVAGVLIFTATQQTPAFAQGAQDFFSNTQNSNQRSVPGTASASLPGFNPCPGDTTTGNPGTPAIGSVCAPPAGSSALLSPTNVGTSCAETSPGSCSASLGIFERLGPGAVTDNMFGLITAPTDPTRCTPRTGATTGPNGLLVGVNCGDLHYDPITQGQSIPTEGTPLTGVFTSVTAMNSDFGPSTDAHTGFDISNTFTWDPTCTTPVCVSENQSVKQVTNLVPGGGGTLAAPGTGDQVFVTTANFNLTNTNAAGPSGPFAVTWTQSITDPEQSGTAATGFTQSLTGQFNYNELSTREFGCPSSASTQGCSQYPNGRTQTLRSSGATATETLP
jgi:hypothetical protein